MATGLVARFSAPSGIAFDAQGSFVPAPTVRTGSPAGEDLGVFASAGLVLSRDLVTVCPFPTIPASMRRQLLPPAARGADAMTSRTSHAGLNVSRITLGVLVAAFMVLPPRPGSAAGMVRPGFPAAVSRLMCPPGRGPRRVGLDPTNRVSGMPEAIELGTLLFFDQRLSGSGTKACATCHVPERNWTDNLSRGVGMAELDRNTPTLMNVRGQRWYGWDGAADSLWSQSLRPILDARELAATPWQVAKLVREDEQLSCRYQRVYGAPPSPSDDEAVFVNVGKVLAAFQETLVSGSTPFDQFRNAVARGESPSALSYSTPAQRGLQIFIGKGGCTACHS